MSQLQVFLVAPFGHIGGAESWLLAMLDATDRLTVTAVLLADGELATALRTRGVDVTVLPTGPGPAQQLRSSLRLRRRLRRSSADVVWANGVKAAAVALPAARLAGIPAVWVKHDFSFDARLAQPLARLADAVVATSTELLAATRRADGIVIEPPRPGEPAGRAAAQRFWADHGVEPSELLTVAMLGRLVAYKGVDDALRALVDASEWRLVVIGADDPAAPGEQARLTELAEAAGVGDRVCFTGAVPGAGAQVAAFDAVAVLTRSEGAFGGEGYGIAALEAMVAGVPVIATTGPVAARLGDAGVAVDPGDVAAVSAALRQLGDPAARDAMGHAAVAATAGQPSAAAAADRFAAVLAAAAGRPGAGRLGGPPLSVLTTVRDEGAGIDRLLAALVPQLDNDDELLVVDGGSRDDTRDRTLAWSRRDDRVRLVDAPGANIPAGRNVGRRVARHDVLACTDAGCDPDPRWLEALRLAAGEPDAAALVTGVYRVAANSAFEHAMAAGCYPDPGEARRSGSLVRAYGRLLGRTYDPSMPTGRSMAVTAAAWDAVGGFPEQLATGEDVTFGRAIVASGRRAVLARDAEVVWRQRPTVAATARMYYRYGVGGGQSRDVKVVGRDLARAVAYVVGPLLLWRGGSLGRGAVVAGGLAYLSLPVARALRRPNPVAVTALVPVAVALKDLTKAAGCLRGLLQSRPTDVTRRTDAGV